MPTLCRITLYPIKSLDGVDVSSTELLPTGPLANDRRYAIYDAAGRLINGKRTPAVHRIQATFAADASSVELSLKGRGSRATFALPQDSERVAAWLTAALDISCTLREDAENGFPDDGISPGPTLLSTGTLQEVGRWFELSLDEVRRRFRPNLEIDADEPFWEDRLFGASPQRPVRFAIGSVRFHGVNPCERCVVPTRDTATGEPLWGFAKRLAALREEHLPAWADREAFDHFYRLMINTRLAAGQDRELRIAVGDNIHC
jgi:uncharacterized protein